MIKSNRGQLSIFMGITLIIVMSMLAFIINVGLFVKAKINLQNATDAAAFSGAATQARQLTNIGYVNWELRNTYKEWMFKYYVLGQIGLFPYNLLDSNISGNQPVSFLLENKVGSGMADFDKFNVPSICIHNNSKVNICPIYALPGLPRFPAIGVAGISEIHEAFVDVLVSEKAKDCSSRSRANFLTAMTWAYGSGLEDIPDAPLVAANRPGAWPQALELAMRIRNLEMIVNRPPVADMTRDSVNNKFQGDGEKFGLNERPVKAFWSAYRNLSGGAYKDSNSDADELSANFKLTELAPQAFTASGSTVSGFLIPDNFSYRDGGNAFQKYYLDLQLMPVNIATLFSTFVTVTAKGSDAGNATGGVDSEAACGISKSALPVPGYILGFNKNPQVLTYYAVKAESKFIGLFLPEAFRPKGGITLTAYAAAKPFGARIGPKLFTFKDNGTVMARGDGSTDPNHRSASYITGLDTKIGPGEAFQRGMPIPARQDFWVNNINPIVGGVPGINNQTFFGIPNMIYDFENSSQLEDQTASSSFVQMVKPLLTKGSLTEEKLGLYHAPQFRALKASLGSVSQGTAMDGQAVLHSIIRARRPTRYDAINYIVPDFREVGFKNNAAPIVQQLQKIDDVGYAYKLFAPLVGEGLLYPTNNMVDSVVATYLIANSQSVETYLQALLDVANSILALNPNSAGHADTTDAARSIHINAGIGGPTNKDPAHLKFGALSSDPDCKLDMASKFNHFFKESQTGCEIVPLKKMMVDFIAKQSANENGTDKSLYYISFYYNEPSNAKLTLPAESLMTAYYPGVRQGATLAGIIEHPLKLSAQSYSGKRNYYSTKFFNMKKVIINRDYKDQPLLKEADGKEFPGDLTGLTGISNMLKDSSLSNSYFLDF